MYLNSEMQIYNKLKFFKVYNGINSLIYLTHSDKKISQTAC